MEQHPVPQNILEVEFKLFGSFTLKQFAKIVLGCVAAFLIFFLPLPILIKFPLMGISVITGVLLAIIPNFGTWLNGYLKALFISPRYVWVKSTKAPDILKGQAVTQASKTQQVSAMQKQGKIDINELPLDKMFAGTNNPAPTQDKLEEDANLGKVYEEVYKKDVSKANQMPAVQAANKIEQTVAQTAPKSAPVEPNTQGQLQNLKFELSRLAKDDPDYSKKESQIMSKINQLFATVKSLGHTDAPSTETVEAVNEKGEVVNQPGQILFGIVVDKKDKPVSDAVINFKNLTTNRTFESKTGGDGKFSTSVQIPFGSYDISISHSKIKFHTYKVAIAEQKLPAYKFRER